jgi:hypothetical protein
VGYESLFQKRGALVKGIPNIRLVVGKSCITSSEHYGAMNTNLMSDER